MKYIFVAGAPGSKWSSVVKNIYYSADLDQSDFKEQWTYYHDAGGDMDLMHLGAYFDPGMESHLPEDITTLSRDQLEQLFDQPFDSQGQGIRIVKSHVFCNHLDFLRRTWPDAPIVLVHRGDDACLGWWVKCGHFDITYPNYAQYYQNLRVMSQRIKQQNQNLIKAMMNPAGRHPLDNVMLAKTLNITPPTDYYQNYGQSDVRVTVI
jgi:hypothetical protein